MFRAIFELLLVIVVITVLRGVIGIIGKALSGGANRNRPAQQSSEQVPLSGELKKDPVCGTFVAVASSVKRNVDGEVIHFCSTACRDKYQIA